MTVFHVYVSLADFGGDPLSGILIEAVATPAVKKSGTSVHSNAPERAYTGVDGTCTLNLLSIPGVWYQIRPVHSKGVFNPVNLAGYVPDVDDPTTGEVFPADTEINLKDVVDEDPTPGYEAIAYVGGGGGGLTIADNGDGTLTIDGNFITDNLDGTLTLTIGA